MLCIRGDGVVGREGSELPVVKTYHYIVSKVCPVTAHIMYSKDTSKSFIAELRNDLS